MNTPYWIDHYLYPYLLLIMGIGIIGIWLVDLSSNKFKSQGNFFSWSEGENRLWPHVIAEFITGIILIVSAIAVINHREWGELLSVLGLGAIFYSCINSSGWVIHRKKRFKYGIPIWISLIISLFLIIFQLIKI